MTPYLIDTNILLRWTQPDNPQYTLAHGAIKKIRASEGFLYVSPQNLVELWNVGTRPANRNGLGLSPFQMHQIILGIECFFILLPEATAIYPQWKQLVLSVGVSGVQVHDARLVAFMQVYGINNILTFDIDDFIRFAGITVVYPGDL